MLKYMLQEKEKPKESKVITVISLNSAKHAINLNQNGM